MQTVGSFGRLLRIVSYSNNGTFTWTLQPDVGFVVVELVGGGGGGADQNSNGGAGGTSSFGAYFSATGGSGGLLGGGAVSGGTGVSGDINITGKSSSVISGSLNVEKAGAGDSYIGTVGLGGYGSVPSRSGGGGGYSKKMIQKSSLTSTVSVVVGAGGARGSGADSNISGFKGIVIIYEYSA